MKLKQYNLAGSIPASVITQLKNCEWEAVKHLAISIEKGKLFDNEDMLFIAAEEKK